MKVVYLLVVLCLVLGIDAYQRSFRFGRREGGVVPPPRHDYKQPYTMVGGWFQQDIDHFNPQDTRKFNQLYYANDQYFNPNQSSVAFLFISGESAASAGWLQSGSWTAYAKENGAYLFMLEHRYYGNSQPTPDLSTANLKYLTSEQALADIASFIVGTNKAYNLTKDVKWIVFGGSYAGSLAAWARFKYPHLIHGAVSTSGPILAEVDFQDYFAVVAKSLDYYTPGCSAAVQKGVEALELALTQDEAAQQKVTDLFNLCVPLQSSLDKPKDISTFFEAIANNFAGIVQYNLISTGATIETLCDIMVDESKGDHMERLAAVNYLFYGPYCLDYSYDETVEVYGDPSWAGLGGSTGTRQWLYQTCAEFGYYQTSTAQPQVFGTQISVDYFIDLCKDLYGVQFNSAFVDRAIDNTNVIYGALDIEVSNTVFVHGSIDPWHALGIIRTKDLNAPAIFIEGVAHCANMYTALPTDPPGLAIANDQIGVLISLWLQN